MSTHLRAVPSDPSPPEAPRQSAPATGVLPLLGRESELGLLAQLDPGGGLVSLIGPAGVGKTRLLLEHLARTTRSATILADLRAARTDEEVVDTIAHAASMTTQGARQARTMKLAQLLAARPKTLLAIDNAEHVVDEVRRVLDDLTPVLDHVFVVVTSRRPLSMLAERIIEVPALSTEAPGSGEPVAVRHFLNALRYRAPASADLTPVELERVQSVVELVDGNPLAIELCAARARLLGLGAIHDALRESIMEAARNEESGRRFDSLREAITWSWRLLDEDERRSLARLSVFPLYFDLESAAPVIGLGRRETARRIESLRAASLLSSSRHPKSADRLRFRMTVAVRELAAEHLAGAERESAEAAHNDVILRAAENRLTRDEVLMLDGDSEDELAADLRAIVHRGLAARDVILTSRAVLGLGPLLVRHGAGEDVWRIVEDAWTTLKAASPARPDLVTRLAFLAQLFKQKESLPEARRWAERALEAAELTGDAALVFRGRCTLAVLRAARSEFAEGRALLEGDWPSTSALQALGDRSLAFIELGEGRAEDALARLSGAVARCKAKGGQAPGFVTTLLVLAQSRAGDFHGAVSTGSALLASNVLASDDRIYAASWVALAEALIGNGEAAAARVERTVLDARANGEVRPVYWSLRTRAYLRAAGVVEGDAEEDLREAMALAATTDEPFRASVLLALSCVVASPAEAARLLGEGAPLIEQAAPALAPSIPIHRAHVALRAAPAADRARFAQEARRLLEALPTPVGSVVGVAKLALERELASMDALSNEVARLAADGSWFRVGPTAAVNVTPTLRSVLRVLIEHYPGPGLTAERLFELAWNGERASPSAASARVYTAVRRLRDLGLRDLLIRRSGGFALDPRQVLRVEA